MRYHWGTRDITGPRAARDSGAMLELVRVNKGKGENLGDTQMTEELVSESTVRSLWPVFGLPWVLRKYLYP